MMRSALFSFFFTYCRSHCFLLHCIVLLLVSLYVHVCFVWSECETDPDSVKIKHTLTRIILLKAYLFLFILFIFLLFSQTPNAALPEGVRWVACQGSQPHLRRYPCGVWTLFHVLTVQAKNAGDAGTHAPSSLP